MIISLLVCILGDVLMLLGSIIFYLEIVIATAFGIYVFDESDSLDE